MQLLLTGAAAMVSVMLPIVAHGQAQGLAAESLTPEEQAFDRVHQQVGADRAQSRGYTGRNAAVAVLDTGFQGDHEELRGQFLTDRMYDATTNRYVAITDGNDLGHGTHVAGIIAGSTGTGYSYGIAPDARILPIKVFADGSEMTNTDTLAAGLRVAAADPRVSVINLSLGGDAPLGRDVELAMRRAVGTDKVIVTAAGNSGASDPVWPGRHAREPWANGQIIVVGAVDSHNVIASFSNRAGDTARWYLVAPGTDVLSSLNHDRYGYLSGTSMAAPVVSGAAALLESAWPQLHASQVAAILFRTATDLGAPGVDRVYGWGLLNVDRAMQPVGPLGIHVGGATVVPGTSAALDTSTASWSGLHAAAAAGRFRGIVVDAFNRDFVTDFGQGIRPPRSTTLTDTLAAAGRPLLVMQQTAADGARFVAVVEQPQPWRLDAADQPAPRLRASSTVLKLGDDKELALASGSLVGSYFGLAETDASLGNPYLGLARSGSQMAMGYRLGKLSFKGGLLGSTFAPATDAPFPHTVRSGRAVVAEVDYAASEAVTMGVELARVAEGDAFLGTVGGEAMTLDAARTSTLTMHGAYHLGPRLTLAAQYSLGRTADDTGDGLLTATRGVRSEAFALGLVADDNLAPGDHLALTLSSPLRIVAGTTEVNMPVAITAGGDPVFERRRVPLAATGRELKLGLDYAVPLSRGSSLAFTGALRNDANHVAGEREGLAGLVYRAAF